MKQLQLVFRAIGAMCCLIIFSCSQNDANNPQDIWANTTWENLDGESIKFRKPAELKKSSRYRVEADLPSLANDSIELALLQNSLEALEFQDAEIDVYVDTTTNFRVVIICNTERIDFGKSDVAILKKQLEAQNEEMAAMNPNIDYSRIDLKLLKNDRALMAKYKTQLTNKLDNARLYNSIYYLTGSAFTLIVYEFSDNESEIEKYLWSLEI